MKIPVFVLTAVLGIIIALQGWALNEIISLKIRVAEIAVRIENKTRVAVNP